MERRKTLRRVVKFPIKGSCGTEGHVYDISQTGLGFSLRRPELSPDSICVDFSPYFSSLDLPVRTVWKKRSPNGDGLLCGGRFAGLDENSEKAIDKILQEKDKIVTASYLPERVVTNQEIIDAGLKATPAILERALGVKERRAAAPDETGADMMAKVAKDILKKASLSPLDIDRIICSGDPGDSAAPDTAVAVQAKIAATCPAYSVSMSCVGWVAGLEIALNHLSSTDAKRILVLASSLVGSRLYFHNLRDRTIFGDAAGGILVERHHLKKILAINLWTAGAYYSKIYVPYPWSASPADIPSEYKGSFYMSPDQKMFFKIMDNELVPFAKNIFRNARVDINDIDLFLLHYPSRPLYDNFMKGLNIPRQKIFNTFPEHGNVIASEMPILLERAINSRRIHSGDLIFMFTYGAGITGGGLIMRY